MDRHKFFRHNTEKLPIDLIIEVLSRLPAKSVAICRCVSKHCDSLLASQVFKESFLTSSLSRPLLLFKFDRMWQFFSTPKRQNFCDNLNVVATKYHMGSYRNFDIRSFQSVHGFIYMRCLSKVDEPSQVICNPCTRQQITLPRLETRNLGSQSFFAYDPIQKQFKVLCTMYDRKYKVLTLGTGELLWREIECSFPHHPESGRNGIRIKGVLYYIAYTSCGDSQIVCFDVSSEKFSFINIEMDRYVLELINYKDEKLGVLVCYSNCGFHAEVWVLDDTNEVKWSKHMFVMPMDGVKSMWTTERGDIVWVSSRWTHPSYISYCSMGSKRVRRVEIKGVEDTVSMRQDRCEFHTSTNHVENLMFLYKKP
ncbi:hypothetical protein CARUB_v10012065mg, partial [Capsella rubella]